MMERDFLGLDTKNRHGTVKEEASDGSKDSASVRGSGMEWSFSNKVSAIPQFLSFKTSQEDRPRKSVNDPLVSSGFMPISTSDAFDSKQRLYYGAFQKNTGPDRQGGSQYPMTAYGLQQHFDAYTTHRSQEVRMFPVSSQPNQTITVSMSSPILQSHLTPNGKHLIGNVKKAQPLGGVPIMASPVSVVPASSSIVGTTDLRYASKSSGAPAQLTIFYAGSVNVYNDVSPEKAQAIMLLAGNGSSVNHINQPHPLAQVQARPSTAGGYDRNVSHSTSPCSAVQSPIVVMSHVVSQPGGGSGGVKEVSTVKPISCLAPSSNQQEPSKVFNSAGFSAITIIPSVALPQARKASLARFLEKRKERVTSTCPYSVSKKSADCSPPGSEVVSFSLNSAGSSPVPAMN
ncbi:protein TIFY 6B isoform X1 [Carica papaya]|uniref:protein TIFY 6B isoform X1 n=2 Tax=Carica papaya TaxID=3649 RepID=UPI000B8D098F|nr:protein TIFY 6B isoform X1 [Carica papaya]